MHLFRHKYMKVILVFFENEVIFSQLDELDELGRITHALGRNQLQHHTSTENILV